MYTKIFSIIIIKGIQIKTTMRCMAFRMVTFKRLITPRVGEKVELLECSYIAVENLKWYNLENSSIVS